MFMGDVEIEGETCKPHCTETYFEVRIETENIFLFPTVSSKVECVAYNNNEDFL